MLVLLYAYGLLIVFLKYIGFKMNVRDKLDDLYEEWLLDNFKDEIHNKEQLIDLFSEDFKRDEFNEEIKQNL